MARVDECGITLIGRLGKDPESIQTKNGEMAVFTVAVNGIGRDGNEKTTWYNVRAFGRQGSACLQFIRKGSLVYVRGDLDPEIYTAKDGTAKLDLAVSASRVQFLDPPTRAKEVEYESSEMIPF